MNTDELRCEDCGCRAPSLRMVAARWRCTRCETSWLAGHRYCGACGTYHAPGDCDLDPANLPDDDNHGPGCDGPLNCVCEPLSTNPGSETIEP